MSMTQTAGYLLEEVVAHLLRSSGYRLLDATDDPDALVVAGNGLRVRGRGAQHQADALGDLDVPIPFSLPVRLFVEAKCVRDRTGLDVIRNAHGVVHDVNERLHSSSPEMGDLYRRRVQYRYSVFSTGGFSEDAQRFALAHQISLVDLSSRDWRELADTLRAGARSAHKLGPGNGDTVAAWARRALREALRTLEAADGRATQSRSPVGDSHSIWARELSARILRRRSGRNDMLLGFVDAPFILILSPEDTDAFVGLAAGRTEPLPVDIFWEAEGPLEGDWTIEHESDAGVVRLTFPLPDALQEVITVASEEEQRATASRAKALLSTITVYVEGRPIRLQYRRRRPTSSRQEPAVARWANLRESFRRKKSLPPEPADADQGARGWNLRAVGELLHRLDQGSYVQGEIIRHAVALGGSVTREQIYDLAGYPPDRTLRGFSRPTSRLRDELVQEGLIPGSAAYPLEVDYGTGVTALQYKVAPEIAAILRSS